MRSAKPGNHLKELTKVMLLNKIRIPWNKFTFFFLLLAFSEHEVLSIDGQFFKLKAFLI